ncbi:hypothetical protein MRX96_046851 [Rhipicephalus microplus]
MILYDTAETFRAAGGGIVSVADLKEQRSVIEAGVEPHVSKYNPRQYSDYSSGYYNNSCNGKYRDYDYRKRDYIEHASSNQDCAYHKICNHDYYIHNEKDNIDCNHENNLNNYHYSNK